MLYNIKNNSIILKISSHGAEVKSLVFNGIERLHDSNPTYWNRSAPLLFPCIGTITDKQTTIDGKKYPLTKHGFIRDVDFQLLSHEESKISFVFKANENTKLLYPFNFELIVTYELENNTMKSSVVIKNLSTTIMPFNFGLHPAFKIPVNSNESFEDYELIFPSSKEADILSVDLPQGTINFNKVAKKIDLSKPLVLNHNDYQFDALVFDKIDFDMITLQNKSATTGVTFSFNGFPMLGIWTPYPTKAPFICIEPWIGCADPSNHDGVFSNKKYIINLKPDEIKEIKYKWSFF